MLMNLRTRIILYPGKLSLLLMAHASVTVVVHANDISIAMAAKRICKSGPPMAKTPGKFSSLVFGDSINNGYVRNL